MFKSIFVFVMMFEELGFVVYEFCIVPLKPVTTNGFIPMNTYISILHIDYNIDSFHKDIHKIQEKTSKCCSNIHISAILQER